MKRGALEVFTLLWALGCNSPTERQDEREAKVAPPATRAPNAQKEAELGGSANAKPTAEPLRPPEPQPTFDATAVTEADVRVTKIIDPGGSPCGVIHSVGAFEVEVLGVGEPPPRLGLYVSCPADLQPRGMLEVGRRLSVTLHPRKQSWPKPARRLDPGLTARYTKSLKPAELGPERSRPVP
ncbi:MAG: hypothetical protein AAF799_25725 [Myxococcota bacterium]